MPRMACVDLPAFALQLLQRRRPDWREFPVAVVDSDRPQGLVLQVNQRARARRILPGMRYGAALALARDLRAAAVPQDEVDRAVAALVRRLGYFTPHVEPASNEPGVFWLDASGLEMLHDSLGQWAGLIRTELKREHYAPSIAVGFGRFGTYAIARARHGVTVLQRPQDECRATRNAPLDRLGIEPATRDALARLGVSTVGALVDLPVEEIAKRFGPELQRLHRQATGALDLPVQPTQPETPAMERLWFDHPESDVPRLIVAIERSLGPVLRMLGERRQAATELLVGFRFESTGDHLETVRPAEPTLDPVLLLDLVRLRLEALRKLPDRVVELILIGRGVAATTEQMRLFQERPRRDLAAASRALARVRAGLGDAAVVRAELREGHLPEGSFTWEPLERIGEAKPRENAEGTLVRRLYTRPRPLPPRPRLEPDGWLPRGIADGPVVRVTGPFVVSGGWWQREVHREYLFAETQRGELLWIFYDRMRRRWFQQGSVE